jgi:hypothetical protein
MRPGPNKRAVEPLKKKKKKKTKEEEEEEEEEVDLLLAKNVSLIEH